MPYVLLRRIFFGAATPHSKISDDSRGRRLAPDRCTTTGTETHNRRPQQHASNRGDISADYAILLVDGEPICFGIEERTREEPREPSRSELGREKRDYFYYAPRVTLIPTGALRIVRIDTIHHWSPRRKNWYDRGRNVVEKNIPKILTAFCVRAQELKAERAETERRQRERAEQERLREEKRERRAAHAQLSIHHFSCSRFIVEHPITECIPSDCDVDDRHFYLTHLATDGDSSALRSGAAV
jgi:hypothetical protein